MKEKGFSYTELMDMDLMTFQDFLKLLQEENKDRIELIKNVQKANPQNFVFNLEI